MEEQVWNLKIKNGRKTPTGVLCRNLKLKMEINHKIYCRRLVQMK